MRIGEARYRWEFRLLPGETVEDYPSMSGATTAHRAVDRTNAADDELELLRVTEYTFRAQIAGNWRRGNVFLLGDAAHLTPPFIGQGMGAGLRDAMNLAWKLAGVLRRRPPADVLDSYERERKPHTRALIRLALNVGRAMTAGGEFGNLVRRVGGSTVAPHSRPARQGRRQPNAAIAPLRVGQSTTVAAAADGNAVPQPGRWPTAVGSTRASATGFAVVSAEPVTAEHRTHLEQRGAVVHIAYPGTDLADWLRRGHATAAIVRARQDGDAVRP